MRLLDEARGFRVGFAARRVVQSSFAQSFGLRGAGLALGLGVNVLLARKLGPAQLGIYAYVFTVITLLAIPVQSGAAALMIREVARDVAAQAWGRLRGGLRAANLAAALLSVLIALVAVPVILHSGSQSKAVWIWALLLLPLYCLANLRGAALRGLQRALIGQMPDLIVRPACLALALLLVGSVVQLDAANAMALHVFSATVAFLIGTMILMRALPPQMRDAAPEYHPRLWLRSVLPFTLIAGVQAINSSLAVLLLGHFATTQDIAYYRVADLGASLVVMGFAAGEILMAPRIARLHALGDHINLQSQVTRMTRIMLLAALPVALVNTLCGDILIRWLFGAAYAGARWPLFVLSIGQLINAGTGSVAALLTMTGHEKEAMRAFIATTVINLILGALLVPHLGALGAAIAAAVALVTLNLTFVWRAKVLLKIRSTPW